MERPLAPIILLVCAIVAIPVFGFGLRALGLFGNTVVERKVFENSYQYQEGRKAEISTYEAQLAELEVKLRDKDLDPKTRSNLEASAAAIRVRLNSARDRAGK